MGVCWLIIITYKELRRGRDLIFVNVSETDSNGKQV